MTLQEMKEKIDGMLARGVDPTMPCFLLHGTDPNAPTVICIWASLTINLYRKTPNFTGSYDKCYKAYVESIDIETWQDKHGTKIPD